MKYNCYVKGCDEYAKHVLGLDDHQYYVCGDHYDDAIKILDDSQDKILGIKRDVSKAIRHLGTKP